jgi:uncharacterized protein (DUF1499 family)
MKKNFILFVVAIVLSNSSFANLRDKKLPICQDSPNCVSSQAEDKDHFIKPFKITVKPTEAWERFKQTIKQTSRMVVTHDNEQTLHAEVTTLLLRFVDDINAVLDEDAGLIHIRSASREGHSDFGVNRKRIEALREQLQQAHVIE